MPHAVYTRDLGRSRSWRAATVRSLVQALLKHERIQTTLARAKETQRLAERLISLGKDGTLAARKRAISQLGDPALVSRLFSDLAPRFAQRPGGYTRILHLGHRAGDGATLAVIELVEMAPESQKQKSKEKGKAQEAKELPPARTIEAPPAKKEIPKLPEKPSARHKTPEKQKAPEKKTEEEKKPKGFIEGLRGFFKGRPKQ